MRGAPAASDRGRWPGHGADPACRDLFGRGWSRGPGYHPWGSVWRRKGMVPVCCWTSRGDPRRTIVNCRIRSHSVPSRRPPAPPGQAKAGRPMRFTRPTILALAMSSSGTPTRIDDLHHLHFLAVRTPPVHLEGVVVVVGDARHHAHLARLAGHGVGRLAGPGDHLATGVHGPLAGHDPGGHVVDPDRDVLLEHVVISGEAHAHEGHSLEVAGGLFLAVASVHEGSDRGLRLGLGRRL